MVVCRRAALGVLFLVVTNCGSRSGLGLWSSSDDPGPGLGSGGTPILGVQAGAFSTGATAGDIAGLGGKPGFAGSAAGGAPAIGGTGARAGAPPAGGTGGVPIGAGGAPIVDDPTTLGDERPGFVRCQGKSAVIVCRAPQQCCELEGCVSNASECHGAPLSVCDGAEDCPASQACCMTENGFNFRCQNKCPTRTIRHLKCGGPCDDTDDDAIPDNVDACAISQFEDGKGPFPEDGCSDSDGDGVRDGLDKCPNQMEDGLPPKPDDGCR